MDGNFKSSINQLYWANDAEFQKNVDFLFLAFR